MEVYVEIFKKNLGHAVLEKTLRKKLRIVATNEIFSLKKFKIFNLQAYCYILCTKLEEMYGRIFRNFFKFFGPHSLEKILTKNYFHIVATIFRAAHFEEMISY